jgi:hypothetical protein
MHISRETAFAIITFAIQSNAIIIDIIVQYLCVKPEESAMLAMVPIVFVEVETFSVQCKPGIGNSVCKAANRASQIVIIGKIIFYIVKIQDYVLKVAIPVGNNHGNQSCPVIQQFDIGPGKILNPK